MNTPGYSGTPLAKKLGIKAGDKILVIDAPKDYRDWLSPLPENVSIIAKAKLAECAIVHLFAPMMADIERNLAMARGAMTQKGALWVSWYKKSAKLPTDITEDRIRERLLRTDLVDVKVCAVSDIWSGLKFVVRKERR
jgi:bifunctional DNA-binding transcriptional regulator/antitoxin component of YhaV-PrlF toxin-antitoxin module